MCNEKHHEPGATNEELEYRKALRICRENHWVYHSPQGMDATLVQN